MPLLQTRAYAKINLGLEVLGRRPDGYHDILTLAQTISLHDELVCEPANRLQVRTDPPVVADDENLVGAAARALAARIGREPSVRLTVRKRIPLAAGLGGGSSDAAATLRMLARLWGVPASVLLPIAAALGSDVPLFLRGGTVLVTGRGERVEDVALGRPSWVVLACPRFDVTEKTRALYAALTPNDWSDGAATRAIAARLGGTSAMRLAGVSFPNAFDRAASVAYPGFAELRHRLELLVAVPLSLSGAGPSLYALFDDRVAAITAARRLDGAGVSTYVARSVARRPRVTAVPA